MVTTRSGRTYTDAVETAVTEATSPASESTSIFINSLPITLDSKSFSALHDCNDGLVFTGCGGDLFEWINGITEILTNEHIVEWGTFDTPFSLCTSGGRTDLVFPFADGKGATGALMMWRLRFGDASWISDYVVNYKSHHM